jgi:hypothetical protein
LLPNEIFYSKVRNQHEEAMSSKRAIRRRGSQGKRRYPSADVAGSCARHRREATGDNIRPYLCPAYGWWPMCHQPTHIRRIILEKSAARYNRTLADLVGDSN